MPNSLTEPLGLIWALLSIPFFIEAFSFSLGEICAYRLCATTVALMTRMGSMFTIRPCWYGWFGNSDRASRQSSGSAVAAIGILLGVFGLNSLVAKAYGTVPGSTGSNFSYTLCGLRWAPRGMVAQENSLPKDRLHYPRTSSLRRCTPWPGRIFMPSLNFLPRLKMGEPIYTRFPETIWKGYPTGR